MIVFKIIPDFRNLGLTCIRFKVDFLKLQNLLVVFFMFFRLSKDK